MIRRLFFTAFLGLSIILMPAVAHGQTLSDSVNKQLQAGAKKSGLTKDGKAKDPRQIIAEVIQVALSLVGMICIILVVTAGYWYLTSHGETEKIDKAKQTLTNAVIGLAITLAAYSITWFVARRLQNTVQQEKVYDVQENSFPPGGGSKQYDMKNFNVDTWTSEDSWE